MWYAKENFSSFGVRPLRANWRRTSFPRRGLHEMSYGRSEMSLSFLAASLTQILGLVVDGLFTTPEVDSFDSTVELFAVVIVSTTKPHRAAGSRVLDLIFVRGDHAFGVTAVTPGLPVLSSAT